MPDDIRTPFYRRYVEALQDGSAALFVGAGLSIDAGYLDWRGLLHQVADDLGLDVQEETDLPALAQFTGTPARSARG